MIDREELREKVARELAKSMNCEWATQAPEDMSVLNEHASAAIDIVLEEAARVADAEASIEGIAQRIAAAIRGMKGKA